MELGDSSLSVVNRSRDVLPRVLLGFEVPGQIVGERRRPGDATDDKRFRELAARTVLGAVDGASVGVGLPSQVP
jgi:hypothetical protein